MPKNSRQFFRKYAFMLLVVVAVLGAPLAAMANDDPFEPINRAVFDFNDGADRYVLRPVAKGYDAVTPTFFKAGVNNFFNNFLDVNAALNALLQGRFEYARDNTGRVVINTTLGFFGMFDVATDMGIPQYQTDFGHTLAIWGAPRGPYVMLPLLGPNTVRGTVAVAFDGYVSPTGQLRQDEAEWGLRALNLIDLRASLLDGDQLITGDRYLFVRDAFLQRRDALVNDGQAVDNFSEFDDGWEGDDL